MDFIGSFLHLRRRNSVKTAECLCEALRCVVSVPVSQIDYLSASGDDIQCGQIQPAVSDILSDGVAGHDAEAFLEIIRRDMYLCGHIVGADILQKMVFHKIN